MKKLDIRNTLAIMNCIGGYGIIILLFYKPVPAGNETMINIALGAIIVSGANNILSWYFGSSKAQSTPTSGTTQTMVAGDATITQTQKPAAETATEENL